MALYRKHSPYRKHNPYRSSGAVTQTLLVAGIAPPPDTGPNSDRQVPQPQDIDFRNRTLGISGIAPGSVGSASDLSHYTRFIDMSGIALNDEAIGIADIEYKDRTIFVPFIASNIFGTALIARIQVVQPSGFTDEFVSSNHEFDINLQRIIVPTGTSDQAHYGTAVLRNQHENISFTGWLDEGFQVPKIYNYTQQLFVGAYMGTTGDPTQWPQYSPFVENKIKHIGPFGWVSEKFSVIGNWIYNNAVPIVPSGWDSNVYGSGTFIAYKNRTINFSGWDSFYSSQYHVIYNNARLLHPVGWQEETVPLGASLANLNRTVTQVYAYGPETFGTAYIDFGLRAIFCGPYNDVTQFIPLPEVRLNPFSIKPTGIPIPATTAPTVFIHFNQFFTSSANVHSTPWVGEPFIANKNKQIFIAPTDQALYGQARISNKKQILPVIGVGLSQLFGATDISRRTKVLNPAPFSSLVVSVFDQIRNVNPDPPSVQRFYVFGNIEPPGFGLVTFSIRTIFPTGIGSGDVGAASLRRNAIEIQRGIFNLEQVGEPVFLGPQYLFTQGIPHAQVPEAGDSDTFLSKPRFSPYYIYAPSSDQAPLGYENNNPPIGVPTVIDQNLVNEFSKGGGWPFFGLPDVANKNRTIFPHGEEFTVNFGDSNIFLKNRRIFPLPMFLTRFGFTVFLDVPQYVNLDVINYGIGPGDFGDTSIGPPPDPNFHIRPIGLDAGAFGATVIELFNREIQIPGIPQRGNPEQGLTNPWGLPLIGYPRHYPLGGYDFTLWGLPVIDFKNRVRGPFGGFQSDTFQDEDIGSFSDRMRFSHRNPTHDVQGIPSSTVFGTPFVSARNRTVYGRAIVEYTVGACRLSYIVSPSGWLDETVGNVDKWEAGKIKPHGDSLDSYGTPRLQWRLIPSGVAPGAVGTHSIGWHVTVPGIAPIEFEGPLIGGGSGCHGNPFRPLGTTQTTFGTVLFTIEEDSGSGHL